MSTLAHSQSPAHDDASASASKTRSVLLAGERPRARPAVKYLIRALATLLIAALLLAAITLFNVWMWLPRGIH
jgi:hypothetical protein